MSRNETLPLVSIVIPHFNRAGLLAESLRSVEAQECPNWEVVVVDDGSDPDQWTAVKRYAAPRIRVLQRTDGLKGPSRCRNLGAVAATGEYIVFLDSDDLLAPWCLAQRLKIVSANPQASFWVFPVLLFREVPGDTDICWNRLAGDDDLERFLRSNPPWHTTSPIWRKREFLDLGGFNEKVMYGDDADLHIRALLHGLPYRKYDDCLPDVFIRRGQQQRITGGLSAILAESRRTRLIEGNRLLHRLHASQHARDLWEGQFFVECEELLFNTNQPQQHIERVLNDWAALHHPPRLQQWMVRSYFKVGALLRNRAYLAVRMARKLAKLTLPTGYFPSGGNFQSWTLSERVIQAVRHKLATNNPAPTVDSSLMSRMPKDERISKAAGSSATARSFHVALFGYYKYGNFGDDLMAVLIGSDLRSRGITFTVCGLLPVIAEEFGFDRTDSIDELLDGADALVFGGGGVFLRSDDREFHSDILQICDICSRRDIPIIMISVGGDGRSAVGLPPARLEILRQAEHITFRNEEDEILAALVTGTYQVHPDLVWLAARKLGIRRSETLSPVVAIDDTLTERATIKWFLRLLVLTCRLSLKGYKFIYFSTLHSSLGVTRGGALHYEGIKDFSNALSAASLVITPRLHAGLVAMSQGIPVMLLAPHGKAELLFKRLGLDRFIFKGKWQALKLLKVLVRNDRYDSEFHTCKWASYIDGAENHLRQLSERLTNLGCVAAVRRQV